MPSPLKSELSKSFKLELPMVIGLLAGIMLVAGSYGPTFAGRSDAEPIQLFSQYIIGFAIVCAIVALVHLYNGFWILGSIVLGIVTAAYVSVQVSNSNMLQMEALNHVSMSSRYSNIQLGWGTLLIVAGGIALLVAAVVPRPARGEPGQAKRFPVAPIVGIVLWLAIIGAGYTWTTNITRANLQCFAQFKAQNDPRNLDAVDKSNWESVQNKVGNIKIGEDRAEVLRLMHDEPTYSAANYGQPGTKDYWNCNEKSDRLYIGITVIYQSDRVVQVDIGTSGGELPIPVLKDLRRSDSDLAERVYRVHASMGNTYVQVFFDDVARGRAYGRLMYASYSMDESPDCVIKHKPGVPVVPAQSEYPRELLTGEEAAAELKKQQGPGRSI